MAKKSIVSVIIPTHNRFELLKRAIRSVLTQTFQNFEILIINDSSTDNTKEIIKEFKDKRIRYFLKKRKPHNPAATRNSGIKRAKGEYIAFLDDDDEWLPEKLEKQLMCFKKNKKIGLVYTGYYDLYDNKKIEKKDIGCSTVVIKKECIDKCGFFDEKLVCAEDRDFWGRIMKKYEKKFINDSLVIHKIHKKQISSNIKNKIKSEEYFIKKHLKEILIEKLLWKYSFKLGILYILDDNSKKANELFKKTIKLNSKFFRGYIYYILSKISPFLLKKLIENIFQKIKKNKN